MQLFAIYCFALMSLASGQLPCSSQLRIIFPQFFTHCECHYSEWSEWVVNTTTVVDVPTYQCLNGWVLIETRTQIAVGQGCSDRKESRHICVPSQEDRLIMALGLGSSGQRTGSFYNLNIRVIPGDDLEPENRTEAHDRCSVHVGSNTHGCVNRDQTCLNITEPRGKRSLQKEIKSPQHVHHSMPPPMPLANDPVPFDWGEHGKRFQRQVFSRNCNGDGIQYILFMLDTSGSIGRHDFNRMTLALSNLTALFCKPIKIAAMTFNHEYHVEFCFDCFDNTCAGRQQVSNAMRNIEYRGGWTHTGGAATCACDFLLSPCCGIDPDTNCTDVVLITDGKSNDPTREVCTEIKCLHNRLGVNTYAIGIGSSVRQTELDCITEESNSMAVFKYSTFADFEESLKKIIQLLLTNPNPSESYTCVDPSTIGGTQSAC